MKKYVLLALVNIFLAIGSAHAQSDHITVDIPFDFVAANTTFHAGRYTIRPMDPNANFVLLRSADLKNAALMSSCNCALEARVEISSESKLVFKMAGTHHYLWQIWTKGDEVGRELPLNIPKTELATADKEDPVVIPAAIFP